jgi:hypothetical protein
MLSHSRQSYSSYLQPSETQMIGIVCFLIIYTPDQLSSSYNVKSDTGKVLLTIDALQEVV